MLKIPGCYSQCLPPNHEINVLSFKHVLIGPQLLKYLYNHNIDNISGETINVHQCGRERRDGERGRDLLKEEE